MLPDIKDIKNMRKRAGITQKELASLTGLSQSYIARLESGDLNPTYENVKKIFSVLEEEISKKEGQELCAQDIMTREIVYVDADDPLEKAMKILLERGFSQLPVFENGMLVGSITDSRIGQKIANGTSVSEMRRLKVRDFMDDPFPQVPENSPIKIVSYLLRNYPAVLVTSKGKVTGIITKSDLLKIL
ncbi:MAG: CBS domain-containing protein [Thermoplasmata archaeon]|jgi:predicted transcriptional regulator|nr:CBS domain-containing protein [Thermoplasmatales archaeon]